MQPAPRSPAGVAKLAWCVAPGGYYQGPGATAAVKIVTYRFANNAERVHDTQPVPFRSAYACL